MRRSTKILREESEVGNRLADLHLVKTKLLNVRTTAISAAADATPFHPANSAGTFAYHHATFALRNEFVGDEWRSARPNGVEAIKNDSIKVMVVFVNVDIACNDEHEPRARSDKGSGSERLCAGNGLFESLPRFVKDDQASEAGWVTYSVMVAPDGAAELTRATIRNGQFHRFIERIYLSDGSDLDKEPKRLDDDLPGDEFEPNVVRK